MVSGSIVAIAHVFVGEEVMLLLGAATAAAKKETKKGQKKLSGESSFESRDIFYSFSLYRVKSQRGEGTYQRKCLCSLTWYRLLRTSGYFFFFSFFARETLILTFDTTSHFVFHFAVSYLVSPPSPRCRSPKARTIQFLSVYSTGKCSLIAHRYASLCFMP